MDVDAARREVILMDEARRRGYGARGQTMAMMGVRRPSRLVSRKRARRRRGEGGRVEAWEKGK